MWEKVKIGEAFPRLYNEKLMMVKSNDRRHFNANQTHPYDSHHHHHINGADHDQVLKESDRIERLPGQPLVRFQQYGGYVTVNRTAGRAFYYYFVEAHHSHHSLPLLLWLNGAANTLFLESPAGVGFSYSNTTTDVVTGGDKRTAIDNYTFLIALVRKISRIQNRDFYISGESYSGHYVPQLAHTILHHNQEAGKTIINLKGIIMGNALMNDETDMKGMYEYLASHAMISDETWKQILKYCDFSDKATQLSDECNEATDEADISTDGIDNYNIYAPLCSNSSLTRNPRTLRDVIGKWDDSPSTVIPLLRELLAYGLCVWIYSGDIDGRIPVTSTKNTIQILKLPIITPWHPWFGRTAIEHSQ
ncbi:UNVERIFIED_CONTAM: Serine carboxypeptidase-like 40 [Sesamum angustifolium]|uniref:Serine carboxypeptidase-like 40 n=1 Tax=Sesamum angustifolium TaxID=2727405 RepID=A0AAW2RHV4_9LAMI